MPEYRYMRIKNLAGKKVAVNKPSEFTHGKEATILCFHRQVGKYEVAFGNTWVGFYKWRELIAL